MSGSRRKHPIVPMTTSESEKDDKQIAHRAFRRAERMAIEAGDEPPVDLGEVSHGDVWVWNKDGRQWWDDERAYRK